MKILSILVITTICGLFALKGQDMSDEARRYYIRGCTAIEMAKSTGGFETAAKELKKAIELAPNFPDAYNKLGEVYEKLEICPEVVECYTKYLSFLKDETKIAELKDKIYRLEFKCENIKKRNAILGEWFALTIDYYKTYYGAYSLQYFKFYLENNMVIVNANTHIHFHITEGSEESQSWIGKLSFPVTVDAVDKINFSFPVKCTQTFTPKKESSSSVTTKDIGNFSFKLRVISDKLMVGIFKTEGFSKFFGNHEMCLIFLRTKDQFARLSSFNSDIFRREAIPCDGIDTEGILKYLGLN